MITARSPFSSEFQVVPPCGGHRGTLHGQPAADIVSSRAPVWGASSCPPGLSASIGFQVVPPCGGHPDWTEEERYNPDEFQVVPPCGGHPNLAGLRAVLFAFQVVPPCGGHPGQYAGNIDPLLVSSRAPVWGASRVKNARRTVSHRFKSCPRVGGILPRQRGSGRTTRFKSCPRVGGIHHSGLFRNFSCGFKSCPRVGGIF